MTPNWTDLVPTLLHVTARLVDILDPDDRAALAAYLAATRPVPVPIEDQVDVMSRAAYDLDSLGFIASTWPFAP